MAKDQNGVLADLIKELLTKHGLKANEIAKRAKINETTLSAIRAGRRRASKNVVIHLAKALSGGSEEENETVNEFLVAAGYAPLQEPMKRSVVIQLYSLEKLLGIERSMQEGQHVWVFSQGLIETLNEDFYTVVCENLKKNVSYTYFFHFNNSVDWVKLIEKLHDSGKVSNLLTGDLLRGFVLPDECFLSTDFHLFECIYDAQNPDSFRVFRTSLEVEDEYLYREVNKREAADIRCYLQGLLKQASGKKGLEKKNPPCRVEDYLMKKYRLDLRNLDKDTHES